MSQADVVQGPPENIQQAIARAKRITISAVVTRADGSIEDKGIIAEYVAPEPPSPAPEE